MANLRIIASNAARRAALSASSTAGLLAVTNLQVDKKSDVWRATGTTATIKGALPAAELASGVALLGNFSPANTMRVRLTNEAQTTNFIIQSDLRNTGGYSVANTAVVTDSGVGSSVGPDGVVGARIFTVSAVNGSSLVRFGDTGSGTPSTVYTGSIYVRTPDGAARSLTMDTCDGTSQDVTLSAQWTRISTTGSSGPANNYRFFDLLFLSTGAYEVFGAQIENGSAATSYYPTANAPAARPLGYIDNWQSYDLDTGAALACPAPAITLEGWTAAQSASAYAYGGGAFARAWFAPTQFVGFAIDLVDVDNLQGYIEAAQLVIGAYWSPTYNASSASDTFVDAATHYLTDAGDLMSQASTINKQVPIDLQYMPASDRATLANILRASRAYPIFLSVFPENEDLELERDYTVYGKRMSDSEVAVQMAIRYGTKLEVKSI